MNIEGIRNRTELAKLFAKLNYKVGAEIGVWQGDYSLVLLQNNPDLKLYCIDPWQDYSEMPYYPESDGKNYQQLQENNYETAKNKLAKYNVAFLRKTSIDALDDISDRSLDFVYIDGAHDYSNVKRDISSWNKKVRSGGIVSGHDYTWVVRRLLGVKQAVNEYTAEHGIKFYVTVRDHSYYWMVD